MQENEELRKVLMGVAVEVIAEYTEAVRRFLDAHPDFFSYPVGDVYHEIMCAFAKIPSVKLRVHQYTDAVTEKMLDMGFADDADTQALSDDIRDEYLVPTLQVVETAAKNLLGSRASDVYVRNCSVEIPFAIVSESTANRLFMEAYRFAVDIHARECGEYTDAPSQRFFDDAVRLICKTINIVSL